jgi:AcrR family transcriptional regulator
LIESAIELFWRNGYSQTSLADVMDRAEVNSGSLYYFFKSKENLLLAVLERYKQMLGPVLLAPVWEKERDPIRRIFGLLARYREAVLGTGCTYGCPIGRLALEIDPELREVHRRIAENFEAWSRAIEKCLEEARDRLPRNLDLVALSRFVLTVMEGGVMQSRAYRSVEPFDQAVRQLGDYFRRLLAEGTTK